MERHPDKNSPFKLCAIALNGSRVMSVGYNRQKTDSWVAGLTRAAKIDKMYPSSRTPYISCFIHAETSALKQLRGDADTLVVLRIDLNGNLTMAKPCNVCMEAIRQSAIKRVYYSDKQGDIQCLRV